MVARFLDDLEETLWLWLEEFVLAVFWLIAAVICTLENLIEGNDKEIRADMEPQSLDERVAALEKRLKLQQNQLGDISGSLKYILEHLPPPLPEDLLKMAQFLHNLRTKKEN